ncbi:MAG TPA: hypothetical protein VLG47_01860 [Candidatus Saccharimonadales bacterium]|nr:hypothetical protein [Candidatus Saccharimonadales bacterium]
MPKALRTVTIGAGTAPYMRDAEVRRRYEGLTDVTNVFAAISVTDEKDKDHLWLVSPAPMHSTEGEVVARLIPVRYEEGAPRPIADELAAATVHPGQGITFQDLLHRRVMDSTEMPMRHEYQQPNNGMVALAADGSLHINSVAGDPNVHVIAAHGAQIIEGGVFVN